MTDPDDDGPDGGLAPADHVRVELVRFARALRRAGVGVPADATTAAARALAALETRDRAGVRTALRAALVTDPAGLETFDRLFPSFWSRLAAGSAVESGARDGTEPEDGPAPLADAGDGATPEATDRGDDRESGTGPSLGAIVTDGTDGTADTVEAARYSPTGEATAVAGRPTVGVANLDRAFRELSRSLAGLPGRRWAAGGDRADARRALRESVGAGGAVLSVPRRERERSAVRALVLVDVSRSVLDTVDRGFLVEFLRGARRHWRDARVFLFDEDLREVTEAVDAPSAAAAFDALERAETEWGGGTRIGESLARLRETAPEAVDRRTAVFVVSDGLEMGDVDALEREVAWLARRGRHLLWLNPLAAADEYEPTARGMAAALPHLDALFAFTGPDDVHQLARQLRRQGPGGRIGYEYDPRRGES